MIDDDALQGLAANMLIELPLPAERIRLRNLFGVSQGTVAGILGISRRTLYAWEHGLAEPTGSNRANYGALVTLWSEREQAAKRNNS
jgi:DNA-binding XRE family transcriptional regulator